METKLNPIVRDLTPGLAEKGKIKIGRKGEKRTSQYGNEFRKPEKTDHFIVTTLERDENDNFIPDKLIHKELGAKPKTIPIRLLYDDIELNFQCRYACYFGKSLWCTGDGKKALRKQQNTFQRETVDCPCERNQIGFNGDKNDGKGICKINGTLSVILDTKASTIGGVWKFRTTGRNSTNGIYSSLALIKSITGGLLSGIPLNMIVSPKVGTTPSGDSVTVYVVSCEFAGNVQELRKYSLEMAQNEALHRLRLINVEIEAKQLIEYDSSLKEERADIVEEFHPEELKPETVIEEPVVEKAETKPEVVVDLEPPKKTRKRRSKAQIEADKKQAESVTKHPETVDNTGSEQVQNVTTSNNNGDFANRFHSPNPCPGFQTPEDKPKVETIPDVTPESEKEPDWF